MELHDIIIKPEFRDFLPSLKDRTALAEKIAAEGWTDEPITVWQHHGILLDGHNRYAIWQERIKNGIDDDGPLIRELKFDSEEAAFYWVVNNQCARRNLTPEEQRYLLGRKYTAEKSVKGGNDKVLKGRETPNPQNEGLVKGEVKLGTTAKRIAQENNVGRATVERAEQFANAVDDLDKRGIVAKSEVLSGKVKAPATRIVAASKAATEEEAKEILKPTKPKATKEDAPTQEPKREESTTNDIPMLTPKEERKRLLAFAKVEKAWTLMKEIPNDDEELRREAFEDLIHRLKCIIKRTK